MVRVIGRPVRIRPLGRGCKRTTPLNLLVREDLLGCGLSHYCVIELRWFFFRQGCRMRNNGREMENNACLTVDGNSENSRSVIRLAPECGNGDTHLHCTDRGHQDGEISDDMAHLSVGSCKIVPSVFYSRSSNT